MQTVLVILVLVLGAPPIWSLPRQGTTFSVTLRENLGREDKKPADLGLPMSLRHYLILQALSSHSSLSGVEIQKALKLAGHDMPTGSLYVNLGRMIDYGLLERVAGQDNDTRTQGFAITSHGRTFVEFLKDGFLTSLPLSLSKINQLIISRLVSAQGKTLAADDVARDFAESDRAALVESLKMLRDHQLIAITMSEDPIKIALTQHGSQAWKRWKAQLECAALVVMGANP